MTTKMHADEVETDERLVRRLLGAQFPQWADEPIERVASAGTDNALYRLGADKVVRLPRIHWSVAQVEKEQQWLPRLAPHLPLAIPFVLAKGEPGDEYPWYWSIYQWIDGKNATLGNISKLPEFATDLARFITALHRIDTTGGPLAGEHNFQRGLPLAVRDAPVRAALASLHSMIDVDAATTIWEDALRTPLWDKPPVWIHGDLQSGNLLTVDGKLSAVIDFGGLGIGDPAVDLIVAWNLLPAESRVVFRNALGVDEATWNRGRGWALSIALIALPYYHETNIQLAAMSRYTIGQILADV